MSGRVRSRSRRGTALAPAAVAAVLLAGLWPVARWIDPPVPRTDGYFAQVASEVNSIPERIGPYIGEDAEVAPSARRLLRPNVIFQRTYQHLTTGAWFSLLITHCGDVRDMVGHYPPVCYPNAGWRVDGEGTDEIGLASGDVPARRYELTWTGRDGAAQPGAATSEKAIVVLNFFVTPNEADRFPETMAELRASMRQRRTRHLGVAQVQIVLPAEATEAERAEAVSSVSGVLADVIGSIADVPGSGRDVGHE